MNENMSPQSGVVLENNKIGKRLKAYREKTLWIVLGTLFVATLFVTDLYSNLMYEASLLISGDMHTLRENGGTITYIIMILSFLLPLKLLFSMVIYKYAEKKYGYAETKNLFGKEGEKKSYVGMIILYAFLEEVLFRYVPLVIIMGSFNWDSNIAYAGVIFVSTFIFAIVHLSNYVHSYDKKLLRVMPQFVGGLFYSYVFLRFGMIYAVILHMGHNYVCFASDKQMTLSKYWLKRVFLTFGLILISYIALGYDFFSEFYTLFWQDAQAFTIFSEEKSAALYEFFAEMSIMKKILGISFFSLLSLFVSDIFLLDSYDKDPKGYKKTEKYTWKEYGKFVLGFIIIIMLMFAASLSALMFIKTLEIPIAVGLVTVLCSLIFMGIFFGSHSGSYSIRFVVFALTTAPFIGLMMIAYNEYPNVMMGYTALFLFISTSIIELVSYISKKITL